MKVIKFQFGLWINILNKCLVRKCQNVVLTIISFTKCIFAKIADLTYLILLIFILKFYLYYEDKSLQVDSFLFIINVLIINKSIDRYVGNIFYNSSFGFINLLFTSFEHNSMKMIHSHNTTE